jgi:hypothetical protein
MPAVPASAGVYVTEQVATLAPVSVQVEGPNEPVPSVDQVTSPVGALAGAASVSVTVAVHVEVDPIMTGDWHATDVDVDRLTACTFASPPLARCRVSPPYAAARASDPVLARVNVTEHVATRPDPVSVHVAAEKLPTPVRDQLTVPVGVVPVPASVSETVALHVDGLPTGTGVSHVTAVEVCLPVAASWDDPELDPCCWLPE